MARPAHTSHRCSVRCAFFIRFQTFYLNEVWEIFREIRKPAWLCPAPCSRVSNFCPFLPSFLFIPKCGTQRGQWVCEDSVVDEEWKQACCFTTWGCGLHCMLKMRRMLALLWQLSMCGLGGEFILYTFTCYGLFQDQSRSLYTMTTVYSWSQDQKWHYGL